MHRPDCRKYVQKDGWTDNGLGFIKHPRFTNAGKSAIIRKVIDLFWHHIFNGELDGVFGKINKKPIYAYNNLEKSCNGASCLLEKECPHHVKDKYCFWRPNQIVTWGKILKGGFEEVVIRSPYVTLNKLCKLLDMDMSVDRLAGILRRAQRTSCSTASPFALGLHQFATVIETKYMEDLDTVYACMVVGQRDPKVENRRDAAKRIGEKKEHDVNDIVVEPPPIEEEEEEEEAVDADTMYEEDAELVAPDEIVLNEGDEPPFGDDDDDNF